MGNKVGPTFTCLVMFEFDPSCSCRYFCSTCVVSSVNPALAICTCHLPGNHLENLP